MEVQHYLSIHMQENKYPSPPPPPHQKKHCDGGRLFLEVAAAHAPLLPQHDEHHCREAHGRQEGGTRKREGRKAGVEEEVTVPSNLRPYPSLSFSLFPSQTQLFNDAYLLSDFQLLLIRRVTAAQQQRLHLKASFTSHTNLLFLQCLF